MDFDLADLIDADDAPAFAVVSPFSSAWGVWRDLFGADHLSLVCGCIHEVEVMPGFRRQIVVVDAARLDDEVMARLADHFAGPTGKPAWEVEAAIRQAGGFTQDLTGAVVAPTLAAGRALARRTSNAGGQ